MTDTPTTVVMVNGYRNVVIRTTLVSDASGLSDYKVFDATSNTFAVTAPGGQLVVPGVHTSIIGLDFDVEGMGFSLSWEATDNQLIQAYGASPESFDWREIGGITVPKDLVGATGSILVNTIAAAENATLSFILKLRKNVPVS